MLRKIALFVLVTAFMVSACGRQVTPDRNPNGENGLPSGYMEYKFRVAQPFNFARYSYVVVFNTSGDGNTPLPFGTRTAFAGYSFAIIVTQTGTGISATMGQYVLANGAVFPTFIPITVPPQLLQLTTNTNGAQTEFTVLFARSIAASILTSPSPSPSPTATMSMTPSPTPSPTPTGATPSPTPVVSATPVPGLAAIWLCNFFVTDSQGTPPGVIVDSLGTGGPQDVSYQSPQYDTTTSFDVQVNVQVGTHALDPAAQITNSELLNSP